MPPPNAIAVRPVYRRSGAGEDSVAVEEPLEIRISGDTVAITMRTPGDDRQLAVGFLFAEGFIERINDVGGVAHCGRPGDEGWGNVIEVTPAPGAAIDVERLDRVEGRRGTLVTSACGVCGRRTIDDLIARCHPVERGSSIRRETVLQAVRSLADHQRVFEKTGGTHAALAATGDGRVLAAAEDVGRHNAVDKVVGALLYDKAVGVGTGAAILAVSGRCSFEIVQKAARARIAVVASVSAPSSLAVDLAARSGITLCAFVRGESMSVFTEPARLT